MQYLSSVGMLCGAVSVSEGGHSEVYQLVLDSEPTEVVSISIDVEAGSVGDVRVEPGEVTFSSDNWNIPQAVASADARYDGVVFWQSEEVVAVMVYDSASVRINSPFGSVGKNGDRDSYSVVLGSEIMPISAGRLVESFEHVESSLSLMGGSIVLDAMTLYDCGAVSGGSAVFGGHGSRSVESPVIDLRHGGVVFFFCQTIRINSRVSCR